MLRPFACEGCVPVCLAPAPDGEEFTCANSCGPYIGLKCMAGGRTGLAKQEVLPHPGSGAQSLHPIRRPQSHDMANFLNTRA